MQYNEKMYNGSEYNLDVISQNCLETISENDVLTKSIFSIRTETQSTSDSLTDGHTLFAFGESITEMDILRPILNKIMAEMVLSTDVLTPFNIQKVLTQLIIGVDSVNFTQQPSLVDPIFIEDAIHVEISNKALNESVRINDWVSFKQISAEPWSD